MELIYKLKKVENNKIVTKEPYSGIYGNRWGDSVFINIGDDLIRIGAGTKNPCNWTLFKKVGENKFQDTRKKGFGSVGEMIKFTSEKNDLMMRIDSDAMESERIFV